MRLAMEPFSAYRLTESRRIPNSLTGIGRDSRHNINAYLRRLAKVCTIGKSAMVDSGG